jgi:MFS transporter, ACS family, hexuronate transporter
MLNYTRSVKVRLKSNFRWLIVGLLFLITLINYIDRASIAYAIDMMTRVLHLSDQQIGLILGAFGAGYAVTTGLGGIAADKFGAKKTLIASIFLWGLATLFTGLANGFMMVFIARLLLGVAEGPTFPALTRSISDWLSEKERARALSFALIAVPISLGLSGPIVSHLFLSFSWRNTYYMLTVLVMVWIPIWYFMFQDKPSDSPFVSKQELTYINSLHHVVKEKLPKSSITWKFLLTNKTLLANNFAWFVYGYYLFFFMTWLPSYLHRQYHLDLQQIAWYSVLPWLLGALMMWGTSWYADMIFKKTANLRWARSYPILLSQLCSAVCVLPIILCHDINYAIVFISLAVGFAMSASPLSYAVNIDVAQERAGTALGFMNVLFAISGFLAPSITGLIIAITGSFDGVFYLMAVLALSSVLTTFCFHNK